jgi:hypothetical protein
MKKVMIMVLFAFGVTGAIAQTTPSQNPDWTISKGVQRMQYKDVKYIPVRIEAGDVALVSSKGIHQQVAQQNVKRGRVGMTGYPSWTISKGAARMRYEKENRFR